ncbi:DUF2243 domain-containing protein [Nodosilinea sp. FACHB-13]|uniref:DUF2243 domain-containing protein n=1 Tax=Cyanophyceae TaxID=3028117 RepID=UPI001685F2D3|nr:DUF2243 domain-containing protein [Nodosilinea sp. FACHB-13]MBD2110082.1 DUF2243 domain-containing protein [Nodosilinea sp. FACHB-13]
MTYLPPKSPSANATESGAGRASSAPTNAFRAAGFLLGFGLGGFIDAIVLHMLLQWHHLISSRVSMDTLAGLQVNVLADGAFSAGMWLITVVGIGVLWRSAQKTPTVPLTTSAFVGWILMGWGGFQLFDSIFFHALLGLHHIRHVPNFMVYDIAFFLLGFGLIGVGYLMTRNQANI